MSKHGKVVSRISDQEQDGNYWLKQFQHNLEKGAVQPREQVSLFDQINSIMNGAVSKYPSVEAAVEDMKARSGLTAYLSSQSSYFDDKNDSTNSTDSTNKTAAENHNPETNEAFDKKIELIPIVFKKHPAVQRTLDNFIRDTKGNMSVPAIIAKLQAIHKGDISNNKDWEDDNLIMEVSRKNLEAKSNNPNSYQNYGNLGTSDVGYVEVDPGNTDAFLSLMPARQ